MSREPVYGPGDNNYGRGNGIDEAVKAILERKTVRNRLHTKSSLNPYSHAKNELMECLDLTEEEADVLMDKFDAMFNPCDCDVCSGKALSSFISAMIYYSRLVTSEPKGE